MASLSARGVVRRFGSVTALDHVSLEIADGAFVTLLGASGCGKSTLLRIVAGLDAQDAGTIAIGGQVVDGLRPRARDVAMVFQSYALYPYMTVAENIALPLVMRRMGFAQRLPLLGRAVPGSIRARRAIAAEVQAVAEALEIAPLLARKPAQLSGGQRQRVALARAMVRHPKLFLMDEPLSNLDARLRVQARAEIVALHRRLGTTFVYVTHDQTEAMTMSDQVAVMEAGRILQVAPPQALYDRPASLAVARFVGQPRINAIPVRIGAGGALLANGAALGLAAPGAAEGPATLALRPEHLAPAAQGIAGRITHIERLGPEVLAHVATEITDEPLILRAAAAAANGLALGQGMHLAVDHQAAHLFDATGARLDLRVRATAEAALA